MQLEYALNIPRPGGKMGDMLSILIDARKIKHGGIGVYLKNLIAGLAATDQIRVTALIYPDGKETALEAGAHDTIEINTKLYSWDELFKFKKLVDFSRFDLFHCPHFTLPFGIPIPTVVTIHDTIHLTHPERWYYPLVVKRFIVSALKRAAKVLTVSEASKRNLQKLYPRTKSPIAVIPNAVDPVFMIEDRQANDVRSASVERENYCLAVLSNQKPHKGMNDLLAAFAQFKEAANNPEKYPATFVEKVKDLKLVLVGQGVASLKHSAQFGPDVEVRGAVDIEDLKNLYKKSQCLIVPSFAEGFCLPVIEAQSCGTPVVARPVPAVLELMTTNDVVAADFKMQSLANALTEFFVRRMTKIDLVDYGVPLAHMQRFDRKTVCAQVIDVYRQLVPAKSLYGQHVIN